MMLPGCHLFGSKFEMVGSALQDKFLGVQEGTAFCLLLQGHMMYMLLNTTVHSL